MFKTQSRGGWESHKHWGSLFQTWIRLIEGKWEKKKKIYFSVKTQKSEVNVTYFTYLRMERQTEHLTFTVHLRPMIIVKRISTNVVKLSRVSYRTFYGVWDVLGFSIFIFNVNVKIIQGWTSQLRFTFLLATYLSESSQIMWIQELTPLSFTGIVTFVETQILFFMTVTPRFLILTTIGCVFS